MAINRPDDQNRNVEGSNATYSCSNDYNLSGDKSRTCGPDGQWTGSPPMCSRDVGKRAPQWSMYMHQNTVMRSVVRRVCAMYLHSRFPEVCCMKVTVIIIAIVSSQILYYIFVLASSLNIFHAAGVKAIVSSTTLVGLVLCLHCIL